MCALALSHHYKFYYANGIVRLVGPNTPFGLFGETDALLSRLLSRRRGTFVLSDKRPEALDTIEFDSPRKEKHAPYELARVSYESESVDAGDSRVRICTDSLNEMFGRIPEKLYLSNIEVR